MLSKKNGAEISLNTQYIKYLSFKNIEAPQIYTYQNIKPNINVSLDMNAIKLQNEVLCRRVKCHTLLYLYLLFKRKNIYIE